jgi:UDP-N-acetylmuramate--alanine ligase
VRSRPVPAPSGTDRIALWPAAVGLPSLRAGDRVHLVGIAGAGMSGLARVLAARGLVVSGSDRADAPVLAMLAAEGITVHAGHDAASLPAACALVVRSPAVPDANPELVAAHAAGVPVTKRAALLGALLDAAVGIAIAGTHGKTTTSGLVAFILDRAGLDPTFFVGGDLPDLGTNARAGGGPHVVIEADEYDRSFLSGHPTVAVVTSIEHDHPDIYPDLDAVVTAFAAFVSHVRPDGRVIARAGAPAIRRAVATAGAPVEWFALDGDAVAEGAPPRWRAVDIVATPEGTLFDTHRDGECLGTFSLRLPGRHNVANALAAIACADAAGVPMDVVRDALARYRGASRRFEVVARVGGVTVVDDYAHHPTEVRATLAAAAERFAAGRLIAVLQPHTFTRVAALADDFAAALAAADRVIVTPVYAARENPLPGTDAARIAAGVAGAVVARDLPDAARLAVADARPGDALLFMGAGDITDASRDAARRLARRTAEALVAAGAADGLGGTTTWDAALAPHTSLKIGGPTLLLVRVTALADLVGWRRLAARLDMPARVLGRGSNILVGDDGVCAVVLLNRCEAWHVEPGAGDATAVVVGESGITLAALGHQLARAGWAGVEAGVGIPGSLGAAVVTNAGAHGWAMSDSIAWAEVLEADGTVHRLVPDDLGLRYRGSVLKGDRDRIVLRVALALSADAPEAIQARIDDFAARRRRTQPGKPSAGSMFRNPPGDFAGRLIEAAGLKGTRCGDAEISTAHANFFVNHGHATARDVAHLIGVARATVQRRFGVRLELEVETMGEPHVD